MKIVVSGILAGLLCGSIFAQQGASQSDARTNPTQTPAGNATAASRASENSAPRFKPGTVIPVELTKSVDAKKAKTGDGVEAKVTQDLKAGNGQVIVPKDTKVVGHVTEAQARNKEQKESQLGITFDRAVMKGGNDVPMPMSIQAIISPDALGGGGTSSNNTGTATPTRPSDTSPSGMPSGSSGGRSPGMSTGSPSTASPSTTGGEAPATTQAPQAPHEQITADTQGVVGISNLKLSPTADPKTGSVMTSDKGNVKLESGTFMLLRVNQ